MQVPSNLILARLGRPNIYLPIIMMIWGLLSALVSVVQSYGTLVVLRLLIGIFEAGFYPGVIYYLSCWYTRLELAKRSSIFILGSYLSGAFSGFISYGVMKNLDGVHGKAAWRWLFIIEGVATVGFSIVCMPILPSLPQNTRWLSKEERLLGVVRLMEDFQQKEHEQSTAIGDLENVTGDNEKSVNAEAIGDATFKDITPLQGVKLAVTDMKVIIFCQILFCIAGTASINTVFPTIVDSLEYDQTETLLLTAPPWILCAITCYINAWHSDRTKERFWHMIWGPAVSVIGFAIGLATLKTAPRYVAIMLLLQIYNSWGVGYAWITSIINQPPMKRAAGIAIVNIAFNVPNIFMPYLFSSGASPHFWGGFSLCLVFAALSVVGCVILRFHLIKLNKKLAAGEIVDGMDGKTGFRFMC